MFIVETYVEDQNGLIIAKYSKYQLFIAYIHLAFMGYFFPLPEPLK